MSETFAIGNRQLFESDQPQEIQKRKQIVNLGTLKQVAATRLAGQNRKERPHPK